MKKFLPTFLFVICFILSAKANDCFNGRYLRPVFQQVDVTKNIKYARKQQSDGQYIDLKYDVYQPHGDTFSLRPVMLLIHGGAYLKLLDQNSPDIVLLCNYFAQRGYVTVSIDYRQEPNILSLLSEEAMVKAVSRALIDTKEAVDHLVTTYQNGNPYRIDTSKAIIGGVSAGAVSSMFISYLDSLGQLPTKYQQWIIQANGISADSILKHKFDLIKPKIVISISGAVLDTNWIKPNGMDFLLVHGSVDEIVPYNYGHPLNIPALPLLFGGKAQYPIMTRQGIRVEFEDWIGKGHVPFFNLDIGSILTLQLINQPILDSTERHIANFCYSLMDCNTVATSIRQNSLGEIGIFPNPNKGNFVVKIPKDQTSSKWQMQIFAVNGQTIIEKEVQSNSEITIDEKLASGLYFVKLSSQKNDVIDYYLGKFTVEN